MNILEIKNLSAYYDDGDVEPFGLSDISLSVEEGEVLCIVGESGSGKSTLSGAVTGRQNLTIEKGSIVFAGEELVNISAGKRREIMGCGIGVIPQNPAGSFNPIRTFEAQLKEMYKSHRLSYDEGKVKEAFEAIGLKDPFRILKSRPYEMSGGMNQRIAIATAMLLTPRLLICDEATSALDVTTSALVLEELKRIREESNTALIVITHNLGFAKHIADRIGIMEKGRLIELGSTEQIIENPGDEYTEKLLSCVPGLCC